MTRLADCSDDITAAPADRLAHAAWHLDTNTMANILTAALATSGVVDTWEQLIRPVLGRSAPSRDPGWAVVVERLLTHSIFDAFAAARRMAADVPVRVLLACADEEQHTLPLEALAAALIEAGVGCHLLGARVPGHALHDAVGRCRPTVIGVWSQTSATADPGNLISLLGARRRAVVVIALGPGWGRASLPTVIARPAGLGPAVNLVVDAILTDDRSPASCVPASWRDGRDRFIGYDGFVRPTRAA